MSTGIVTAALVPHPPLIVPEVGRRDLSAVQETVNAMEEISQQIVQKEPETVILITPHGVVFRDACAILGGDSLEGSFADFGVPQVRMTWENDLELVQALNREARQEGVETVIIDDDAARSYGVDRTLDHGAMVPLYYLNKAGLNCRLVHITYGFLPYLDLFRFGTALRRAVDNSGRKVALVASGDLSHCLIEGAPAGYHPQAAEFDRLLVSLVEKYALEDILKMDRDLIKAAGECALRSFIVAWGALDGLKINPRVLSYQGPFGVGYMIASLNIEGEAEPLLPRLKQEHKREIKTMREQESIYVRLARRALEGVVKEGKLPPPWQPLPGELNRKAASFVSIKKGGALRGCIGTTEPREKDLAREIMANAVSAGLRDPRFPPVTGDELDQLTYSVDVLTPMEKTDKEGLDPHKYGVMVKKGGRSGLLLPNLEGIDTVEEQTAIAKQKAGIDPGDEDVEYYRFRVERYF